MALDRSVHNTPKFIYISNTTNKTLSFPVTAIATDEETGESGFDYHHFPHKLSSPDSLVS